jgi:hypothetical protein
LVAGQIFPNAKPNSSLSASATIGTIGTTYTTDNRIRKRSADVSFGRNRHNQEHQEVHPLIPLIGEFVDDIWKW